MKVGEADLLAHPLDQLASVLTRQALPGGGDQQRSFGAGALGLVNGVRYGGVQGRDGCLGVLALAFELQHAVAALLAEILDVGADGLGDSQAELE